MRRLLILALLFLFEANLSWGAVTINVSSLSSDSDFLNTGTLIEANNVGLTPSATTINGVVFGTSQTNLTGYSNGAGDFSNGFSSAVDLLLSSLVFTGASNDGTLSFSSLTIGQNYRLQLFFHNDDNDTGDGQLVSLQATSQSVSDTGFATQMVINFSALNNTETITIQDQGTGTIVNGYALYAIAVPEPATSTAIIGLAAIAVIAFSRHRRERR